MRIVLTLAFRNLIRHRRKTLLLGALIAAGLACLFIADAIFESSNRGLHATYVGSLTGDLVVGASSDTAYGLFGSEVPIASDYETIPAIADFPSVEKAMGTAPGLAAWTPIVSVAARVQVGGFSQNGPVFGVDGANYFKVCEALRIEAGDPAELLRGGVFLNSAMATQAEASLGRPLAATDIVQFSTYSGGSFRIRTGHFAGVYSYPARSEVLDRIVLADPTIVRSLANYTLGFAEGGGGDSSTADQKAAAQGGGSLDSLFASATDITTAPSGQETSLASVATALSDTSKRDQLVLTDKAAWSFVLAKADPGKAGELASELQKGLGREAGAPRLMDWRAAAGSSAQALLALQSVFYVALAFIALGAILVIMNSLVISVLERTGEIGTMRGIGASRGFIRGLFVAESMLLTLGAGLLGIALGVLVCLALGVSGIPIGNPFLAGLFGGTRLLPQVTGRGILIHGLIAALVGATAWIYPVSVALKIQPVTAMSR